ncbi:MAG: PQQ-binding-like beta-propeller repeat protein, partial [Thermomicrobiales bacterium]
MSGPDLTLNRRRLLGMASAVAASGMLARGSSAQDAASTPTTDDSAATPVMGTSVAGIQPGDVIPPEFTNAADTDWLTENRNLAQDRSAKGSTIDSSTVSGLTEAWTFDLDAAGSAGAITSNPIVVGDRVFIIDSVSNVFALNRESGELIWSKTYDAPIAAGGPTGLGVGYGAIVHQVGNGGVVAHNIDNGEELWSVDITGPMGEGVTMAPLVYNNRVWISTVPFGVESAESGVRGGFRG